MTACLFYGDPSLLPCRAFGRGLQERGVSVLWRDYNHWSHEVEACDFAVIFGMRQAAADIVEAFNARGRPIVVIDHGFLRRVHTMDDYDHGTFYVGLGGLGWVPPKAPSGDRLAALGVTVAAPRAGPVRRVLICGQVPRDASHRLNEFGLARVYEALTAELLAAGAQQVLFRPHPLGGIGAPRGARLSRALDLHAALAEVDAVASINSNAGLDAILAGFPAMTTMPAHYSPLAYRWPVALPVLEPPSPAQVTAFLERLAYAQWTAEEMAQGLPQAFLASIGATP